MKIEVFGTCCQNCKKVEANARQAVKELGIKAEIVKVEDFGDLIKRGITATPGLAVNGEIVSLGRVPLVEEIKEMIQSSDKRSSEG